MKFQITRTSLGLKENIQPCKEALRIKATYLDVRTKPLEWFKSHIEDRGFKSFLTEGKNHKDITIKGELGCMRELGLRWIWIVEIESLKALIEFSEKYGEIILLHSDYKEVPSKIEIYDYYRE